MDSSLDLTELEKLRPEKNINHASNTRDKEKEVNNADAFHKRRFILEPALIGAMVAINLNQTSLQNFYLRTACNVDLGYDLDKCDALNGGSLEADSQRVVSGVNISRSFVGSLIATAVLLFVGPWSDYSGRRKPVLILPLIGMSVMTSAVILLYTFPGATTVQVLYAVQLPISMGGNFGLLLAAAFSHIGDVCHATGRDVTKTMGTHRAAIQVAHVIGSVCGPLLFRTFGYYGVFPIVLLLQLASLTYVIFFMKDVNINADNKVSVINYKLPYNAIHCLLRKREGKKRMIILLMLVVALGDRMLLSAEVLLAYMYYRYKFNWNDILFGTFLAYRNITSFLGTLIILAVFKRRLRLSDEMVGVLSCFSCIVATSGLVMSFSTVCVFLVPIVGIISQGSQVVQRPILNKQILPNEQGKIYSVLGALESATQTISSPLYSLLYEKTVANNPDAWLVPGIVLAFIQILCYYTTTRLKIDTTDNKLPPSEKTVPLETLDAKAETLNNSEKTVPRETLDVKAEILDNSELKEEKTKHTQVNLEEKQKLVDENESNKRLSKDLNETNAIKKPD